MRRELFALYLPNPERVTADYAVLAELSKGLSGGNILNICLNAIYAGSTDANPERWEVTHTMIEAEIKKARKAKAEHSGDWVWGDVRLRHNIPRNLILKDCHWRSGVAHAFSH